jgi:hypothetical protein
VGVMSYRITKKQTDGHANVGPVSYSNLGSKNNLPQAYEFLLDALADAKAAVAMYQKLESGLGGMTASVLDNARGSMGRIIGSASLSKKEYLKRAVSKYQQARQLVPVLNELRSTPPEQKGNLHSLNDSYGRNTDQSKMSYSGAMPGRDIFSKLSTKIDDYLYVEMAKAKRVESCISVSLDSIQRWM